MRQLLRSRRIRCNVSGKRCSCPPHENAQAARLYRRPHSNEPQRACSRLAGKTRAVGCLRTTSRNKLKRSMPVQGGKPRGKHPLPPELLRDPPKRRFSELAREAFCNQEDACALQQRLDDEAKPVIAQGKPLVL